MSETPVSISPRPKVYLLNPLRVFQETQTILVQLWQESHSDMWYVDWLQSKGMTREVAEAIQ